MDSAMPLVYRYLFAALWLGWAAWWWLMSINVKAAARREPLGSRLLHVLPLILAAWLFWQRDLPVAWLNDRFIVWAEWEFWAGAALTALGLAFAVWARIRLGRNWSGIVTIKEEHELVASGPYAVVRHPIYTGLLLGFVGSALALGEWRGLLAVVIAFASLWRKLRFEERWMREQFGERYREYSGRVAALVPFLL